MKDINNSSENRFIIISNGLEQPYDEGIKKFSYHFTDIMKNKLKDSVMIISIKSEDGIFKKKLFFSKSLRKLFLDHRPNYILYIPTSSASLASLIRAIILKMYCQKYCKVVIFTLQPFTFSWLKKMLTKKLLPDLFLTQSFSNYKSMMKNGIKVDYVNAGVDIESFIPVSQNEKYKLRQRYNIPLDNFVLLHVGHINISRNLEILIGIKRSKNISVIVVGSTTTKVDAELLQKLVENGIIVITKFVPPIFEIYQLSDAYIFPTQYELGAVGVPLSVLEAMACNLPIITSKFGRLPELFDEGTGFFYFRHPDEVETIIDSVLKNQDTRTREKVLPYSWDLVAEDVLLKVKSLC